jgi:hypothetical protein
MYFHTGNTLAQDSRYANKLNGMEAAAQKLTAACRNKPKE